MHKLRKEIRLSGDQDVEIRIQGISPNPELASGSGLSIISVIRVIRGFDSSVSTTFFVENGDFCCNIAAFG